MSGFIYEYRLSSVNYNTAKYFYDNQIIHVDLNYTAIPEKFLLRPAYPNPSNPTATISYSLPEPCHTRVIIYDIIGNLVRELVNRVESPGVKNVIWDSRNDMGEEVPSGMYIYSLQAGSFKDSNKLLLIR